MLTERTLKNWRKDALSVTNNVSKLLSLTPEGLNISELYQKELASRILRLTQELLDIQLMKKG